jgi:mono/diheme cytochrome c family protein
MNKKLVMVVALLSSSGALADEGESLFNTNCAMCHQPEGRGAPGLAPPLANKQLWSKLGASAPLYLQGVMLAGMSGPLEVEGQQYQGLIMPPQDRLSDKELASIGNYILRTLNGVADASLTEASVGQARAAAPTHAVLRDVRKSK